MAYLTQEQLESIGFKSIGNNAKISSDARFYRPEKMVIGDNVRIDDFCIISGKVTIGNNVHIAVYSYIAGCDAGVTIDDYAGLAYGCRIFTDSDDYSGRSMTNPTIPEVYKPFKVSKPVHIGKHCILGAGAVVMPGVNLGEGCSAGVYTFLTKSTEPWGIYVGNPAKRLKERSKDLLKLCEEYESQL